MMIGSRKGRRACVLRGRGGATACIPHHRPTRRYDVKRLTVLAFLVLLAAQGAFAASEAESAAADEGPVVID
jgi:hypothetical protein